MQHYQHNFLCAWIKLNNSVYLSFLWYWDIAFMSLCFHCFLLELALCLCCTSPVRRFELQSVNVCKMSQHQNVRRVSFVHFANLNLWFYLAFDDVTISLRAVLVWLQKLASAVLLCRLAVMASKSLYCALLGSDVFNNCVALNGQQCITPTTDGGW